MIMKLLIIGHAFHGKHTVANMLANQLGLKFTSFSDVAAHFIFNAMTHRYKHVKGLQNKTKPVLLDDYHCSARFAKKIMDDNDIYIGMRLRQEFNLTRPLFDHIIWVDARHRHVSESAALMQLKYEDANIYINNNGDYDDLITAVDKVAKNICDWPISL